MRQIWFFCSSLALLVTAVFADVRAAEPTSRLQIKGPTDSILTFTVRDIKEPGEPLVTIGKVQLRAIPESLKVEADGSATFEVKLPADIKPGKVALSVKVGGESLRPEPLFEILEPLIEAGTQPLIHKVEPVGGLPSATIKLSGRNFGNDLTKIGVIVGDSSTWLKPIALSKPDAYGEQELRFSIPSPTQPHEEDQKLAQILSNGSICRYALLTLNVSNRTANYQHVHVLHPRALARIAGLSLGLVVILLSPLLAVCCWQLAITLVLVLGGYLLFVLWSDQCWIFAALFWGSALALLYLARTNHKMLQPIVKTLFIDKDTETYSLSKVQAFAWTVVIMGSYVYYAVGHGILAGRTVIPDLNAGLLGLLGISYGGLLFSRGISRKKHKNDFACKPPRWTNLITEGGGISITRLQLIGFTIAGISIYLFYISNPDLFFAGMPDIPPTLNGLMAISQGGYLGGKIVSETAVNYLIPRRVRGGESITIFGTGFVERTKVLIQGIREALDTEFLSSASLKLTLPASMGDLGMKQMVFIPPTGASFVVSDILEHIDPEILAFRMISPKRVSFMLKGIEVEEEELRPSAGDEVLRVVRKEESLFILESDTELPAGAILTLKTSDGEEIGTVNCS